LYGIPYAISLRDTSPLSCATCAFDGEAISMFRLLLPCD
jgi:hypothetical protein